jgi:hypothetical protein
VQVSHTCEGGFALNFKDAALYSTVVLRMKPASCSLPLR